MIRDFLMAMTMAMFFAAAMYMMSTPAPNSLVAAIP